MATLEHRVLHWFVGVAGAHREGEPLVCCFLLCGPFALSYGTSLQLNALWPIANKWTCPVGLVQSLAP